METKTKALYVACFIWVGVTMCAYAYLALDMYSSVKQELAQADSALNAESNPEKGNKQDIVEITTEQQALLKKISVNEARIDEGVLLKWQKEVLLQYDYSLNYLEEKYPSYDFHITDCEPKNKLNPYSTFTFREGLDTENYYSLYLHADSGNYYAEDNFYGTIIKEDYESGLMKLLQDSGIPCDGVEARINTPEGEQFYEGMGVEHILCGKLNMNQITTICIDRNSLNDESPKEVVGKIQHLLEDRHVYGGYFVEVYDSLNADKEVVLGGFNVFN